METPTDRLHPHKLKGKRPATPPSLASLRTAGAAEHIQVQQASSVEEGSPQPHFLTTDPCIVPCI